MLSEQFPSASEGALAWRYNRLVRGEACARVARADVVIDGATGYAIVAEGLEGTAARPSLLIAANYPDEYRFRPADPRLLSSISLSTGGRYEPDAAALRPGAGDRSTVPTRLWPWLLVLALAAYLADLLLRRVRIFEQEEFAV